MSTKPKCQCWTDPQSAAQRETQIDGIEAAIQISVQQACNQMGICSDAYAYTAGAVMAGLVFWVAFNLRGDGEAPTAEQFQQAGENVVQLCRERLEGARWQDLDRMVSPTETRN